MCAGSWDCCQQRHLWVCECSWLLVTQDFLTLGWSFSITQSQGLSLLFGSHLKEAAEGGSVPQVRQLAWIQGFAWVEGSWNWQLLPVNSWDVWENEGFSLNASAERAIMTKQNKTKETLGAYHPYVPSVNPLLLFSAIIDVRSVEFPGTVAQNTSSINKKVLILKKICMRTHTNHCSNNSISAKIEMKFY